MGFGIRLLLAINYQLTASFTEVIATYSNQKFPKNSNTKKPLAILQTFHTG
jgi:hypothetical protein